jgi:hypothetical protein
MKRKALIVRAIAYSRLVVPSAPSMIHKGRCVCRQCVTRRAWLTGFKAGRRAKSEGCGGGT